jgi:DNA-directed RNA polymerase subunit RPC12/RpoP
MGESPHVCGYERCGRAFDVPLWLTDLSRKPQETYYACPYCFSKMDEVDGDMTDHLHSGGYELSGKDGGRKVKGGGGHRDVENVAGCPHSFGYLKSRGKSEGIPDGCLTCSKILQCMV